MLAFDFEGFMGRDLFCRRGGGDSNCENGTSNDSYVEEEEEEDIKHRAVSKYETMAARIEKGRAKGQFFGEQIIVGVLYVLLLCSLRDFDTQF